MRGADNNIVLDCGLSLVVKLCPDRRVIMAKKDFGTTIVLRSLNVKSHRLYIWYQTVRSDGSGCSRVCGSFNLAHPEPRDCSKLSIAMIEDEKASTMLSLCQHQWGGS